MIVLKTEDMSTLSRMARGDIPQTALDVAFRLKELFGAVNEPALNDEGLVVFVESKADYGDLKHYGLDIEKHAPQWVRRIPVEGGDEHIISLFAFNDGSALVLLSSLRMLHERLLLHLN